SLKNYLSSLRPFSVSGPNSDWGWAGPENRASKQTDCTGHAWPVLFTLGTAQPRLRDPLAVQSLPSLHSANIARIARAIGESAEGVRCMALAIFRFDRDRLQKALMVLLCLSLKGTFLRLEKKQSEGCCQKSMEDKGCSHLQKLYPSQECNWTSPAGVDFATLPAMISETTAHQALNSGFLTGVFSEDGISTIIASSRPAIIYDSMKPTDRQYLMHHKAVEPAGTNIQSDPECCEGNKACLANINKSSLDKESTGRERRSKDTTVTMSIRSQGLEQQHSYHSARSTIPDALPRDPIGLLVEQFVGVVTTKFRLHCVAVYRGCLNIESKTPTIPGQSAPSLGKGQWVNWATSKDITVCRAHNNSADIRPASGEGGDLGLPPLKLARGRKQPQQDWGSDHEVDKKDKDPGIKFQPRSTPRCLRPGFKGKVTATILRAELEESQHNEAWISLSMARKAEAWTSESAGSEQNNSAQRALARAAVERMGEAMNKLTLDNVRQAWSQWIGVIHHEKNLEVAGRLVRVVGALALGTGVMEPLLWRKQQRCLLRWAAAMRAERVVEVQAAALEIQRSIRGMLGRRQADRVQRSLAATAIQKVIRGHAGRTRAIRRASFLEKRAAVKTIECKYKEFVWVRTAMHLKAAQQLEHAATSIQAAWRGFTLGRQPARILKRDQRRNVAALMIQRLWRGVLVRVEADALLEEKIRHEAAVKIQAMARRRCAWKAVFPIILRYRAACCLQQAARCAVANSKARIQRQKVGLACYVNPLVRGFLGRIKAKQKHEGYFEQQRSILMVAVAAQKIFRGQRGRLLARRMLMRQCAAVELQRRRRGFVARQTARKLLETRNTEIKAQAATWRVAITMQKLRRGLLGRRDFLEVCRCHVITMAPPRPAQCCSIRTCGMLIKQEKLRLLLKLVSSANIGYLEIIGHPIFLLGQVKEQNKAAAVITRCIRRSQAHTRHRKDTESEAGRIDKDDANASDASLRERSDSTTSLRITLDSVPLKLSSSTSPITNTIVQEAAENLAYYEMKVRYLAAQESAHGPFAMKIQGCVQAFLAKKTLDRLRVEHHNRIILEEKQYQAATTLQAQARGKKARNIAAAEREAKVFARKKEEATLMIQCLVRCMLAIGALKKLRHKEDQKIQRCHLVATRLQAIPQNGVGQALVRGRQTRDIWRKFYKNKRLVEREQMRTGAQRIQMAWRCSLARDELRRRRVNLEELAKTDDLERYLQGLLGPALEEERQRAYVVRLQCWWRGILSVQRYRSLREERWEAPVVHIQKDQESAALVIQASWKRWRGYRAVCFYVANYSNMYYAREKKKYCAECEGQYATRQCSTCLDKFCQQCWDRIHLKVRKAFHIGLC
ncbi:unnamed protein product, partial [Choristocarpus tenellus]